MPSKRHETALAFIGDFATLDVATMLSRRADDCVHTFLPANLGMPVMDNAMFGSHVAHLRDLMPSFPVFPEEVIEDDEKNMVVVRATSQAYFHDSVKDDGLTAEEWSYMGTYTFFLTMDESGLKIKKIIEFVDSKGTEKAWTLIKRARDNFEKSKK